MPPAPALFSTTKVWPSVSCNVCATTRAAASVTEPAANGVRIVTVRVG